MASRFRALVLTTGRELCAPVHLVMLGLLAAVGLHELFVETSGAGLPVGLLVALLAAVYLLAPEVCRRAGADAVHWRTAPRVAPEAALWLIAITALWLSLTVVRLEFELLVAPLYFVYLLVIPATPLPVIAGLTGVALLLRAMVHGHPQGALSVLGLLVGAGLSYVVARLLARICSLERRDSELEARLRRVCEASKADEREAGRVEERGRLAQDVHDTVAQGLSAMAMLLRAADESLPAVADLEKARTRLRAAAEINSVALGQASDIVHGIAYSELGEGGLPTAVDRYVALVQRTLLARDQVRTGEQRVALTLRGAPFQLPLRTESALLRVIQEAVNNALRHGWATRVEVVLHYTAERLAVEIRDNGVGLPPGVVAGAERPPTPEGLGLDAMRDRVEGVGGVLALSSWVGRGTIVAVDLPLGGLTARLTA